jgi:hypothetical protein
MFQKSPFRSRLNLEALESRENPSVSVLLNAGVLTVTGDSGTNVILLVEQAGKITFPAFPGSPAVAPIPVSQIRSIVIDGGAGNDVIGLAVEAKTRGMVSIAGGAGFDALYMAPGSPLASVTGIEQTVTTPSLLPLSPPPPPIFPSKAATVLSQQNATNMGSISFPPLSAAFFDPNIYREPGAANRAPGWM